MKKFLVALLLSVSLVLAFTACGDDTAEDEMEEALEEMEDAIEDLDDALN